MLETKAINLEAFKELMNFNRNTFTYQKNITWSIRLRKCLKNFTRMTIDFSICFVKNPRN